MYKTLSLSVKTLVDIGFFHDISTIAQQSGFFLPVIIGRKLYDEYIYVNPQYTQFGTYTDNNVSMLLQSLRLYSSHFHRTQKFNNASFEFPYVSWCFDEESHEPYCNEIMLTAMVVEPDADIPFIMVSDGSYIVDENGESFSFSLQI